MLLVHVLFTFRSNLPLCFGLYSGNSFTFDVCGSLNTDTATKQRTYICVFYFFISNDIEFYKRNVK